MGERHRRYGETRMNKASSRSHAIFRAVLESWPSQQRKEVSVCTEWVAGWRQWGSVVLGCAVHAALRDL